MKPENIINLSQIGLKPDGSKVAHYDSNVSDIDSFDMGSKLLFFEVRELAPGKLSCPYHFHTDEEEVFIIIEGEALLRQNNSKRVVKKGDLLFFKRGPEGAHQLFNHTDLPMKYLDLSTNRDTGRVQYPDSNKISVGDGHIYKQDDQVDYYSGEINIPDFWM